MLAQSISNVLVVCFVAYTVCLEGIKKRLINPGKHWKLNFVWPLVYFKAWQPYTTQHFLPLRTFMYPILPHNIENNVQTVLIQWHIESKMPSTGIGRFHVHLIGIIFMMVNCEKLSWYYKKSGQAMDHLYLYFLMQRNVGKDYWSFWYAFQQDCYRLAWVFQVCFWLCKPPNDRKPHFVGFTKLHILWLYLYPPPIPASENVKDELTVKQIPWTMKGKSEK